MQTGKNVPRIEYKKILYTTDLSEAGRSAFPYAASIANRYAAELTVFHVVEAREFEKYLVGYMSEALWAEIKTRDLEEARQLLVQRKRDDAAIREAVDQSCQDALSDAGNRPYVTYDLKVEMGNPVDKIIEEAHRGGYDLVVIGKHGHGALQGVLMGETARRVVRRCRVPVLVVQLPKQAD
jgi:nucleotide-binding universal stress UspA family protein